MSRKMAQSQPPPISTDEQRRRLQRVDRIARSLGFAGRIEYRHESRATGGAQIGLAKKMTEDCLVVDARAFERDADPDDFSLEAIIAHERGHQILHRHPMLGRLMATGVSTVSEEVMASLVGSVLASLSEHDQNSLHEKARFDAAKQSTDPLRSIELVDRFRQLFLEIFR